MSVLTDRSAPHHPTPRPAPGGRGTTGRSARSRRRKRHTPLAGRYIGYVLYFVGAGLISGAVVHHPLDPARYTAVGLAGVGVFLIATLVNEFLLAQDRPPLGRGLVVIGASLLLSFGIGMLSGGLQHFDDFPARGAVLVPLGVVVSYVAFVIKDPDTPARRLLSPLGLAVLLLAGGGYFGLSALAAGMGGASAEGGGHSHGGGAPESDEHRTQPETATPDNGSATPSDAPSAGTGGGGEGSDAVEPPGHADTDDGHAH
ncbi:hypothetical protein ACFY8W_23630 [Streptomyces sp. NPDC012637]|uniref:hypothetical protein n=1 Tax=Streptomyces sp. NPDC012637 TaxID=3364842 RepID=UPI0036EDA1CF